MNYKVIRVLNNSVVLAERISDETEVILLGKGVGVYVSKNKIKMLPHEKIQRLYELKNESENDYLKDLVSSVSPEIITITSDIIKKAEGMLQTKFRQNIFFSVLDHLSFAVERNKEQIENPYPYLEEMKILLNEEYQVCEQLVNYINHSLGINLKSDEAILLAIHFANARLDVDNSDEEIIAEILNIISMKLKINLNNEQARLHRLKAHLRFFIKNKSVRNGDSAKNGSFKEIERLLSKEYASEYQCARLIVEYLRKKHKLHISNNEVIYLTMYIIPIVTK